MSILLIVGVISSNLSTLSQNNAQASPAPNGNQWSQVSAGGNFNCAIAKGEVYCWGGGPYLSNNGQLGNGTTAKTKIPSKVTQAPGLLQGKVVTAISTGAKHVCALAGGEIYCWGENAYRQLGDGTSADKSTPVKVTQAAGLLQGKTVTAISAGNGHTCAIADGEAYCWGENSYNQLGDGTALTRSTPVKVTQAAGLLQGKTVTAISAGSSHTCAIADGEAYCWGHNLSGQLGDGTTTNSSVPVKVTQAAGLLQGKTITSVSVNAGNYSPMDTSYGLSCAIADGEAYCWGGAQGGVYNYNHGQLGNGTTTNSSVPVKVTQAAGLLQAKTVTSINVASEYVCALADGSVYCWGDGRYGRIGNNSTTDSSTPVLMDSTGVMSGKTATALTSNLGHACMLADGEIYCWGEGGRNRIFGIEPRTSIKSPVDLEHPGLIDGKTVTIVAPGADHTCVLADGAPYCWGWNYNGQLGNNSSLDLISLEPVAVDTSGVLAGKTITDLKSDAWSTCALADGAMYCWGYNYYGQMGNGTTVDAQVPVAVDMTGVMAGKTITAMAMGNGHFCAIADGEAYCWGYNYNGYIGDGTTTNRPVPVKVTQDAGVLLGKTVTGISASADNTCVIADGKAYCWGGSALYSGSDSLVPLAVDATGALAGKTVTALNVGATAYHTCLIADSKPYCWGWNDDGQLGNNSTVDSGVPVAVDTTGVLAGKTATSITTGEEFSCAVADGKPYCWGANWSGQLGDGTGVDSSVPVAVDTTGVLAGKTITSLAAGMYHICAAASGKANCWGENYYGDQVGVRSYLWSSAPLRLGYIFPTISVAGQSLELNPTIPSRTLFSGNAQPDTNINISIDSGALSCVAVTDSEGNWTCSPVTGLLPGAHTVSATFTTINGDISNIGPYGVSVDPFVKTVSFASLSKPSGVGRAVSHAELTIGDGACANLNPNSIFMISPSGKIAPDRNVTIIGGIAYSLSCISPGGSANASISLGELYQDTSTLRAYKDSGSSLIDITDQVSISNVQVNGVLKTVIGYSLTDGTGLDEDSTGNGVIVDPIFIGVLGSGGLAETGISLTDYIYIGLGLIIIGLTPLSRRFLIKKSA